MFVNRPSGTDGRTELFFLSGVIVRFKETLERLLTENKAANIQILNSL